MQYLGDDDVSMDQFENLPLPEGVRARFVNNHNGLTVHVLEAGFHGTGTRMRILLAAGMIFGAASLLVSRSVEAQVAESGYTLPLSLAIEAATEAIRSCEAHGYAVSAAVVDTSGIVKVQAKGDHSTIHTQDASYRKAYTVVTFGPIFNLDTTSQIAALAKDPGGPGPALTSLPNVLALAGGVAIRRKGEIVAALGVGGSPGAAKDEACAEAGVAKIRDRVVGGASVRAI